MEGTKFKNIYEGEYMISELIKRNGGCYSNFDYDSLYQGGTNISLRVITYNPIHKTHFLLHRIDGINALDALHKMYAHIYNIKELLQQKKILSIPVIRLNGVIKIRLKQIIHFFMEKIWRQL